MKSRKKAILIGLTLAAVLIVNLAVNLLPYRPMHPEVSGTGVYELSDDTRRMLSAIGRDAEIIYYANSPDSDLRSFLACFANAHVTVKVEKPASDAADQTVLLRSGDRTRTVGLTELYYYTSTTTGEILSLAEYAQISAYLSRLDSGSESYQMLLYYYGPDVMQSCFMGDAVIGAALRNLTSGRGYETVYVLTGDAGSGADWYVSLRLEQYGYLPQSVNSLSAVPAGATVWLTPAKDLSEAETATLRSFLSDGGRLFLTTDYRNTKLPSLAAVLADYGLSTSPEQNLVADVVTSSSGSTTSPVFPAVKSEHAINAATGAGMTAYRAHQITVSAVEGVNNSGLLKTSGSGSYTEKNGDGEPKSETGTTFYFAASAVKGESRVVWIGMPFGAADDSYSGGANSAYAAACLSWLGGNDGADLPQPVGRARVIPSALLNAKVSVFTVWIVIFVVLIPLALLALALVLRYIRNRRTEPGA